MKKSSAIFYKRSDYNINKYWKPGMPITDKDLKLLEEVRAVYQKQGYVPAKKKHQMQDN